MKSMKCDLCGEDQVAANGVLCTACREAIVRLVIIQERELQQQSDRDQLEGVVVYPERTKNTRQAGS